MLTTESYTIIASLFPRFLGIVYFCAFGAFLFQIKGLLGENGILPAGRFLERLKAAYPRKCYFYAPGLFWLKSSDSALMALVGVGTALSLCLAAGFFPSLLLFILFWLYLSIISIGQDFLSFGWEVFLQEITINAFFLSLTSVPNPMIWLSINLLLFRFHFQGGAVKLQSKDIHWRDLTACWYHYQSQPLPNTIAWYAHKMPMWFHKGATASMFVVELIVPFGIFLTEEIRLVVAFFIIALQGMIWLTGNFSYLNHLTVFFSLLLINDRTLSFLPKPEVGEVSMPLTLFVGAIGSMLCALQLLRLWDHFCPDRRLRKIFNALAPFHVANRYGIFAVMTTNRYEIVAEGSNDGITWQEYLFRYKPSEASRRPRRISPYQPRIDWQAWFLPFSLFAQEPWYQSFLVHLLQGTKEVLSLLRHNPFPDSPPKYIRAQVYLYEYTTFQEKKVTGNWWKRRYIGRYSPDLQLR